MRGVRFDQYEFPSFRTILRRIALWCVALLTPLLALYLISNDKPIYASFLMVFCLGASYLLYKESKRAAASYQARRDQAAITLFNAVRSGVQQKFGVFLRPFYTTDRIETKQPLMIPQWLGGTMTFRTYNIEHPLEDTLVEPFGTHCRL